MKIGCCTNMAGTPEDKIGIENFSSIAAMGFDYLELPLADVASLDEAAFGLLRRKIQDCGIVCEACNNFFPATMRLTGAHVDEAAVLAYVERALGRAGQLEVSVVVFGSGAAKSAPEGFPIAEAYEQLTELTRRIAPIAEKHGVTIVIEPLRREESNLVNTFEQGCRMAERIGHAHIKVLVDYFHLTAEREPVSHLIQDGQMFLRHAHFARYWQRSFPTGVDEEEYASFAGALRAGGYNSRISLEASTQNFMGEAGRALAVMRALFDQN